MSLTLILIIMTGLISYQALRNPSMQQKLLFHPYSVKHRGEYYRFFTHGFVHGDLQHLLINMFVLYQFGRIIEIYFNSIFGSAIGKIAFLGLYLSAIVLSSLPDFFRHQDHTFYRSVGASGATSALVFAFILFDPWQWFLFPPLPALLFGVAYLWYSSYMDKRGMDNIGHNAHFWGAVYGIVFTLISAALLRPEMLNAFLVQLLKGPSAPPFL